MSESAAAKTFETEPHAETPASGPVRFPRYPRSWYRFGMASKLRAGARSPVALSAMGKDLIAFRDGDGKPAVLDGRCSHLGARLKYAEIVDNQVRCPLHGWCYSSSGECVHIPSLKVIPPFARQNTYPCVERFGELFYFVDDSPKFEFPEFSGAPYSELHPARPFGLQIDAPWYMITGNGFDIQHFKLSHDRSLLTEPRIDHPHPDAIRVRMRLGVDGDTLRDRIIRRTAGDTLEFSYTCWGGTLAFVEAEFEKAKSYGFVAITPLTADTTWYSNTIFVKKRRGALSRAVNLVNAELRRMMIFQFLKVDIHRIEGTFGAVQRCIEADRALLQYFDWVQRFH